MDNELTDIARRLQAEWPGVDVAAVVDVAYRRLAENARVTSYLPVLTEHLARTWLKRNDGPVVRAPFVWAGHDGATRNGGMQAAVRTGGWIDA